MIIIMCPFCGAKSDDAQVIITWLDDTTTAVHCKKCAAYGPYGKDPEEAVEKWNRWYHWWLFSGAEE